MVKVRRWAAGQRQKAQDRDAAYQKAAKGAGTQSKAGYCLTLLSEPDGQSTAQGGQQAAKGAGGPGCSLPKKAPEDRDAAHQKLAKKFCCSWHALPLLSPGVAGLHTIPTMPYILSYIHYTTPAPHTLHHTPPPRHRGRGTALWLTHDDGRGGWNAGDVYIYIYRYIYIDIYIYRYIYIYIDIYI